MPQMHSRNLPRWEALKAWANPDASRPLEQQAFQWICALAGLLSIFVVIPLNNYQGLSPWVNRELFVFGLVSLAVAFAARRGHYLKRTMLLAVVACLDLLWFPNGGSQGSIGLYFITVALYLVLFFKGSFRLVGVGLLLVNVLLLHVAELTWPGLVHPFANPIDRLVDLGTGYAVSFLVSAMMLWALLEGFHGSTAQLKDTLQALQEGEERFRKVFHTVPVVLSISTIDEGRFLAVNRTFEAVYGYSEREVEGRTATEMGIWADPAERAELLVQLRQGLPLKDRETRIRRKDGCIRWVSFSGELLTLKGAPYLLTGTVDITERKEAEAEKARLQLQLFQAQKMESIGCLAGGVAHDMNNVLGAILGLASVHSHRAQEGSALRKDMETIANACERGGKLVKGLLGFARQQLAEQREVDLNALIQDQVDLLARTTLQKVRLVRDLAPGLPRVKGDPSALSLVIMNLCVNAVDAMGSDGTLTLRTGGWERDTVLLEVVDTGCGMPKAVLEKALDPFFTTKPQGQGTGLGLPLVYGTVKAHGGSMEIQSESGQGTRVLLRFPACPPSEQRVDSASGGAVHPRSGFLHVLLVDDDLLIQEAVLSILEALGHRATTASGGERALAELEAGLQPDVVILDLNMPGLDGAGTLPRLRALRPGLPILLATGRVDQAALRLMEAHPGVGLLPKPFDLGTLRTTLEALSLA